MIDLLHTIFEYLIEYLKMDNLSVVCLMINTVVITVLWYEYWKFKHIFINLFKLIHKKMEELAQILNEQSNETSIENSTEAETYITDRLMAVVVGGKAMHYLGKDYTVKEIEQLDDVKRKKLYARYEAKLGSEMVKSLGSTVINTLVRTLGYGMDHLTPLCEIDDSDELQKDLEKDPIISSVLSSILCEIYYKYGGYLAPISFGLITTKHIQLKKVIHDINKDGTSENETNGE